MAFGNASIDKLRFAVSSFNPMNSCSFFENFTAIGTNSSPSIPSAARASGNASTARCSCSRASRSAGPYNRKSKHGTTYERYPRSCYCAGALGFPIGGALLESTTCCKFSDIAPHSYYSTSSSNPAHSPMREL